MSESKYNSGVVAVIRTENPQHALNLGRAFADTAISAIEVTMTVPDALRVRLWWMKESKEWVREPFELLNKSKNLSA